MNSSLAHLMKLAEDGYYVSISKPQPLDLVVLRMFTADGYTEIKVIDKTVVDYDAYPMSPASAVEHVIRICLDDMKDAIDMCRLLEKQGEDVMVLMPRSKKERAKCKKR